MTITDERLADEQIDAMEQTAQTAVDALWERNVGPGGGEQIDDQRVIDGVNILFDLINQLRAERAAHQWMRDERDKWRSMCWFGSSQDQEES